LERLGPLAKNFEQQQVEACLSMQLEYYLMSENGDCIAGILNKRE